MNKLLRGAGYYFPLGMLAMFLFIFREPVLEYAEASHSLLAIIWAHVFILAICAVVGVMVAEWALAKVNE